MGTASIPSRVYQAGENTLIIPQSRLEFDSYKITLTRESWPAGVDCTLENGRVQPNVVVQIIFERSDDGGATWRPAGSATFPGGVIINRNTGLPLAESSISFDARNPVTGAKVRQTGLLRVRAVVLVSLRTAVTISAEEPA